MGNECDVIARICTMQNLFLGIVLSYSLLLWKPTWLPSADTLILLSFFHVVAASQPDWTIVLLSQFVSSCFLVCPYTFLFRTKTFSIKFLSIWSYHEASLCSAVFTEEQPDNKLQQPCYSTVVDKRWTESFVPRDNLTWTGNYFSYFGKHYQHELIQAISLTRLVLKNIYPYLTFAN